MELEDKTYQKIVELCENGDRFLEKNRFKAAISKYNEALSLIPLPKTNWDTSTWIYTALGDAYFINEEYEKAKDCFYNALNCPDGHINPLILMRLGQCLYECNELSKAKEFLLQAYMLEGDEIFEDEDQKYIESIKLLIKGER